MARPRKPAKVLELSGTFKANPRNRRKDPELGEISEDAPKHLSLEAQAMWTEIVGLDKDLKAIKGPHAIALEMLATELAEYRKNPLKIGAEVKKNIRMLLKDFLMTPADSLKLATPVEKESTNRFSQFKKVG